MYPVSFNLTPCGFSIFYSLKHAFQWMLNHPSYGWIITFFYIPAQFSLFQVRESLWVTNYIINSLSINLESSAGPQTRVMVPVSGTKDPPRHLGLLWAWRRPSSPCWQLSPSVGDQWSLALRECLERKQSALPDSRHKALYPQLVHKMVSMTWVCVCCIL